MLTTAQLRAFLLAIASLLTLGGFLPESMQEPLVDNAMLVIGGTWGLWAMFAGFRK